MKIIWANLLVGNETLKFITGLVKKKKLNIVEKKRWGLNYNEGNVATTWI